MDMDDPVIDGYTKRCPGHPGASNRIPNLDGLKNSPIYRMLSMGHVFLSSKVYPHEKMCGTSHWPFQVQKSEVPGSTYHMQGLSKVYVRYVRGYPRNIIVPPFYVPEMTLENLPVIHQVPARKAREPLDQGASRESCAMDDNSLVFALSGYLVS